MNVRVVTVVAAMAALAVGLSACGKKEEVPATEAVASDAPAVEEMPATDAAAVASDGAMGSAP